MRGRYLTAIDLGLLQGDVASIDHAEPNVLLARLRDLTVGWLEGQRPLTAGASAIGPRLAELRQSESLTEQQVASLRLRRVQLRELSQARHLSESLLSRERDRLAPASWLVQEIKQTGNCPFCGSENHVGTLELARLGERVAAVEAQWRGVGTIPPMLDAEEIEIRRALEREEEQLRQIRSEKAQLEQLTATARKTEEERAVFVGKLMEFLGIQRMLSDDAALEKEIGDLETEEQALRAQVDADVIAQRKEDALLLISKYAQHYGEIVELENNNSLIKLDTKALTIRVINDRGKSAWLSQIGSGANHLGYHVATLLALHEFFVAKPIPYVPSLLIFDQPSQTQFPDDLDEEDEQEELLAVRKAFEAFDDAIDRTKGVLQVIVSEHAGKMVYAGIRQLTIVERWRRGRKLIPWHWDAEALEGLNGRRADWAIDDIREMILIPALAKELGLSSPSEISGMQIDEAIFANLGIAFEARVSVSHPGPSNTDKEGLNPSEQLAMHTVRGSIWQDLSVSISEIQTS